jgi:hypothetical protein
MRARKAGDVVAERVANEALRDARIARVWSRTEERVAEIRTEADKKIRKLQAAG